MTLTVSDLTRIELFRSVIEYRVSHPDCTIEEACKEMGVPRSTFYGWIASESEAMQMVKETLNAAQKASLFEFSQRIYSALELLLNDVTNSAVKADTRLRILRFAIPLFEDYAKVHHATPGTDDQAPFLKTGPKLEHAQSRLATLNIGVDELGVKIDIMQDKPILEGETRELDPDQIEDEE